VGNVCIGTGHGRRNRLAHPHLKPVTTFLLPLPLLSSLCLGFRLWLGLRFNLSLRLSLGLNLRLGLHIRPANRAMRSGSMDLVQVHAEFVRELAGKR
jgi:hypothetical protein